MVHAGRYSDSDLFTVDVGPSLQEVDIRRVGIDWRRRGDIWAAVYGVTTYNTGLDFVGLYIDSAPIAVCTVDIISMATY